MPKKPASPTLSERVTSASSERAQPRALPRWPPADVRMAAAKPRKPAKPAARPHCSGLLDGGASHALAGDVAAKDIFHEYALDFARKGTTDGCTCRIGVRAGAVVPRSSCSTPSPRRPYGAGGGLPLCSRTRWRCGAPAGLGMAQQRSRAQ